MGLKKTRRPEDCRHMRISFFGNMAVTESADVLDTFKCADCGRGLFPEWRPGVLGLAGLGITWDFAGG